MNSEAASMIGALVFLVAYLVAYVELRAVAAHTKRTAEAAERAAAWLEHMARRQGGG